MSVKEDCSNEIMPPSPFFRSESSVAPARCGQDLRTAELFDCARLDRTTWRRKVPLGSSRSAGVRIVKRAFGLQ